MTVKIDGTNTVANPAFTGADTDTGLQVGTDELNLVTGGTERVVVNSSGLVGIGTTSPTTKLHVQQSAVTSAPSRSAALYLENNANCEIQFVGNSSNDCQLRFGTSSNSFKGALEYELDNDNLKAYTNGSERLRIDSSGNLGIGTSSPGQNLHVSAASGTRIQVSHTGGSVDALLGTDSGNAFIGTSTNHDFRFIANNAERMRVLSGGGLTFNSDTAQANALDDYEEGTWTPTIVGSSITYANQVGRYTKIGNIVHIHAAVSISGGSVPSSFTILSGLPYTSRANDYTKMTIATNGGNWNGGAVPVAQVQPNATTIAAIGITDNAGFNNINANQIWDANGNWLEIAGFYYVS